MTGSARDFAVWAHGSQEYNGRPYVAHLDDVAELVRTREGLPDWAETLAYLHDVYEDTEVELDDVTRWFGILVRDGVSWLSDPPGKNRRERKARLHKRLQELPDSVFGRVVLTVKTADRVANMRACVEGGRADLLKMYAREHQAFRDAVYREGLCDDWWAELDETAG